MNQFSGANRRSSAHAGAASRLKTPPRCGRAAPPGRWGLGLIALLLGLVLAFGLQVHPTYAATVIAVNTTGDATGASCPGTCTLRAALAQANAAPGTYEIDLPAGAYDITRGELQIGLHAGTTITIAGGTVASPLPAARVVIKRTGSAKYRLFTVDPNDTGKITATIQNVTITNGVGTRFGGGAILAGGEVTDNLTVANAVIDHNSTFSPHPLAGRVGGGIAAGGGNLTVTNTTFSNNTATNNGGGAISFIDSTVAGNLTITGSTFVNNSATVFGQGGAVYLNLASGSTGKITSSTFTGNHAGLRGGAIFDDSGATVNFNHIAGNTAPGGGTGVFAAANVTTDATNNWWGCSSGPDTTNCDGTGTGGTAADGSSPGTLGSVNKSAFAVSAPTTNTLSPATSNSAPLPSSTATP